MVRDNADVLERLAEEERQLNSDNAGAAEREASTRSAFEEAAATLALSENASVILATLLLKESVGPWRWSAVVLGFAGVLLIAQPGSGDIPLFGAAVALAGAFMVALISIQIADLNRTDKPVTIVFYFALFSVPMTALALPFVARAHDTEGWLLLLAIGGTGVIGQLLLTAALRFGAVASVIVMDYSSLFWATLYGWLFFASLPPPSTWLGTPLIVAAGLVIAWREHRLARPTLRDVARMEGT